MRWIWAADSDPPKQVGLVRASVHVASAMEHLADLNAAPEQILSRGLDVSNDQIKALSGAGSRRRDVPAEDDRAPGARRRELNHAKVLTVVVVGVESPPEPRVELLRAIDIRDGDNDDFELHVDFRNASLAGGVVSLNFMRRICHVFPPLRLTGSLNASVSQQNHMVPKAWRSIPFAK